MAARVNDTRAYTEVAKDGRKCGYLPIINAKIDSSLASDLVPMAMIAHHQGGE